MKTITYKFNDGSIKIIEVSDEMFAKYEEIQNEDNCLERKETRRHQSLEKSLDNGWDIADPSAAIQSVIEKREEIIMLKYALTKLTKKQLKIFLLYNNDNLSFTKIGEKLGINKDTAREHYLTAIKKIKKIFAVTPRQMANLVAIK